MQTTTPIPRPALVLGWLGVLPFAALALATAAGRLPHEPAATGLLAYGVVILSFMGGAHWGLSMLAPEEAMGRGLTISVLPALIGFACWFLPMRAAFIGLTLTYAGLLAYDISSARAGIAPVWYPALRRQLTGAVILCLLLGAVFGG
ncbi:MAG: DUF3429 domain-containing protein [Paracoccaceae bacterium]|nr:DUF3429 domain-containing protein [Paracoccaceae bacterium]